MPRPSYLLRRAGCLAGTVVGLTRFKTRILGVGDLYTLLVKPAGQGDAYAIEVSVPPSVCHNSEFSPNQPSNTLVIPYEKKVRGVT